MKKNHSPFKQLLYLLIIAISLSCSTNHLQPIDKHIDWEGFLDQHDLMWNKVPKDRGSSAFIGNGMIGTTIWSAREEVLHFDLGRTDVYETGDRQFRMPIGKLILKSNGNPEGAFQMRQSIYRAEVTGSVITDKGKIEWRSMIPHERMVGLTEFTLGGDENIDIELLQLPAVNSNGLRNALRDLIGNKLDGTPSSKIVDYSEPAYEPYLNILRKNKELFRHPTSTAGKEGNLHWLIQALKDGGGYVVAYGLKRSESGKVLLAYTVDFFPEGNPTPEKAVDLIRKALSEGYQEIATEHYQWWDQYYRRSFVSIPHKDIEGFYWLQLYKMASATREDGVVLDQIGPWLRATAWARVWNNTNIQIAYHSMMTSNRLDLCEPFIKLMNGNYQNFEMAVPEAQRGEGILAIGRTMDLYGKTNWVSEYGNLSWVLHDYWMYCRYSGREELIVSELFPLLKGAARYMMNSFTTDNQGSYHFPPDISPEYSNSIKYKDVTYDLCLFRWNANLLLYLNDKYNLHDEDAGRWKDALEKLVPYPVNENGLMIGSETPFDRGHRHYSHLMPFYPLRELDPDSPEGHALFKKSFEHWESMPNGWNLFSHFGAASMSAWLRDGERVIRHMENGLHAMTPSSFFPGPGPAIESVLCGVTPVGEMLIQSWTHGFGDFRISVFPAIPESWKNVCFDKLRAEGAFEVSAAMEEGNLKFVEITSLAGNPCRVEARFNEKFKAYGDRKFRTKTVQDTNGREYTEIDLKKGETVQLIARSAIKNSEKLQIQISNQFMAGKNPPNIVFILADDLGWRGVGCFGSDFYETPNIDKLASEGMKFINGYSTGVNCAPSRACIMSGQYVSRHGVYSVSNYQDGYLKTNGNLDRFKLIQPGLPHSLDNEVYTIAETLKKAGYLTGMFGKWHLGSDDQHPSMRGFDQAIESAGAHYGFKTDPPREHDPDQYLSDFLCDNALEFIEKSHQEGKPFFLYFPDFLVHKPLEAKAEFLEYFNNKPAGKYQKSVFAAAMTKSLDETVGRILKKLSDLGIEEETFVVFTSDNGGLGYEEDGKREENTSNHPLKGIKGMEWEGGMRVPYIFRWPGKIPAASVSRHYIINVDLYETFRALAGAPPPPQELDGVNLLPVLQKGDAQMGDHDLFWYLPFYSSFNRPCVVIRRGKWKFIYLIEEEKGELYDTESDIGETKDLAADLPELADDLSKRALKWLDDTEAPRMVPNPDYKPVKQNLQN